MEYDKQDLPALLRSFQVNVYKYKDGNIRVYCESKDDSKVLREVTYCCKDKEEALEAYDFLRKNGDTSINGWDVTE